ncbi:Beta-barrel assembly machine subunit BamE [Spongiibacter sp. IMCC21906]|jgi:outer membrane protein assembly factor BamE|uniref:outer membrane protein assembly factor BamE n=1 Tax=Spongiibacter sp. IMCC21906 TaxID=1620392 RepID=UPI00062DE3E2|nr:outer membrane protein assembly factor BamE [Spongiibacter sp. IMCC21906]AKH70781.1 Beta-barrel assembly machine subunit BamE [Spongiibacter sp. IMCC21906]
MLRRFAITSLLITLGACSSFEFPGAYKLAIDQGNIITGEMVSQLEVGMSRSQVEYVLGTPLIRDTFSPNRWDYLYTLDEREGKVDRNQLSVFFENDRVARFDTNVKPEDEKPPAKAPEELLEDAEDAADDAEE